MPRRYSALPTSADLPALEHEVLHKWQDSKIFERSLEQTTAGPRWNFYEGPPTANGMPGVHHIEGLHEDLAREQLCRYRFRA